MAHGIEILYDALVVSLYGGRQGLIGPLGKRLVPASTPGIVQHSTGTRVLYCFRRPTTHSVLYLESQVLLIQHQDSNSPTISNILARKNYHKDALSVNQSSATVVMICEYSSTVPVQLLCACMDNLAVLQIPTKKEPPEITLAGPPEELKQKEKEKEKEKERRLNSQGEGQNRSEIVLVIGCPEMPEKQPKHHL